MTMLKDGNEIRKYNNRVTIVGLDLADVNMDDVFNEIEERLSVLKKVCAEKDTDRYESVLGEFLFSAAALSGLMKTDSEQSLYNACDRYIDRFRKYENTATDMGLNIQDSDTCITNQLWKDISKKEKLEEN